MLTIEQLNVLKSLNELNYTEIKNQIQSINEADLLALDKDELGYLIKSLNDDNRKNVNALAVKIHKTIEKYKSEIERVNKLYSFDRTFSHGNLLIAGVDEVGRGPLAGPIVSAAVILNLNVQDCDLILHINDSKKLSEKVREQLSALIMEKAVAYNISAIDNSLIDSKGIAWSNNEVLKRACEGLKTKPDLVLSDGFPVRQCSFRNKYIIKGDAQSASIACASIIAKVYRDTLMKDFAVKYPMYHFEKNVGYGTEEHVHAIKQHGPCEIHRRSFLNNIL